jgi:hypothetical protein
MFTFSEIDLRSVGSYITMNALSGRQRRGASRWLVDQHGERFASEVDCLLGIETLELRSVSLTGGDGYRAQPLGFLLSLQLFGFSRRPWDHQ